MFFGREPYLRLLESAYRSDQSRLVVLYGRRRIGKSSLVAKFSEGKPHYYAFEAMEDGNTRVQIDHCAAQLRAQLRDPLLESLTFATWHDLLTYVTERLVKRRTRKKLILFFDELQWMAARRSRLVSVLKYFWDNHFKSRNVMLILCGSVAAFMVRRVLSSTALYGRIHEEILLRGLPPNESYAFFRGQRSIEEALKYLLVFGGVPRYLEEIDLGSSFNSNINRLCFRPNAPMRQEIERIFYSQFKEAGTYRDIVLLLRDVAFSLKEIGAHLGIATGGGLRSYLQNLENAEIITSVVPFGRGHRTKLRRFILADEFLRFYFKYMEPNLQTISESTSRRLFERLAARSFEVWLGVAFERFCLKHSGYLARLMGFEDDVLVAAPLFERGDRGFQVDLLYRRADNVITVCEAKHHSKQIDTSIIPEMERKCALIKLPRGHSIEKALVSLHGPSKALQSAGYFNYYVTLQDILMAS